VQGMAQNRGATSADGGGRMLTTDAMALTDGVVSLRKVSASDAEVLYHLRMDPLSRPMFRKTSVVPYELHQKVMREYLQSDSRDCWFVITVGLEMVGAVALYNFENEGRTSEWGRFVIAPEARKHGYGRRALRLLMQHARSVGVQTLHCEVLATNFAAAKLYRDLGFEQTGQREYAGRRFLELTATLNPRL
jgi:RimJ/RimL family protein N-acetyltransferase